MNLTRTGMELLCLEVLQYVLPLGSLMRLRLLENSTCSRNENDIGSWVSCWRLTDHIFASLIRMLLLACTDTIHIAALSCLLDALLR